MDAYTHMVECNNAQDNESCPYFPFLLITPTFYQMMKCHRKMLVLFFCSLSYNNYRIYQLMTEQHRHNHMAGNKSVRLVAFAVLTVVHRSRHAAGDVIL